MTEILGSIVLILFVIGFLHLFLGVGKVVTSIKDENVIIKFFWKKTVIPISEIRKIVGMDMIRQGYQITIHTQNETHYSYAGQLESFGAKLKKYNPNIVIEERTMK